MILIFWALLAVLCALALGFIVLPLASPSALRSSRWSIVGLCILLPTVAFSTYHFLGASGALTQTITLHNMPKNTPEDAVQILNALNHILTQQPTEARQLFILAQNYMSIEHFKPAIALLERAKHQDSSALISAQLAKAYYLANHSRITPKIDHLLDDALHSDPNNLTALTLKGIALFSHQAYQQAIVHWRKVLTLDPKAQKFIKGAILQAQQQLQQQTPLKAISD